MGPGDNYHQQEGSVKFDPQPYGFPMTTTTTRRDFLRTAGATGLGVLCLSDARTALGSRANERLNLAVVGMAGYGAFHSFAQGLHRFDNVGYAMGCDVDPVKVARVHTMWKERAAEWSQSDDPQQREAARDIYGPLVENPPKVFADYRRMLDEARDSIDAVVVATPDHTHAVIAAAALQSGKPVFCEKPLTIAAHEARALRRLVRETGLPTQMNNQGASSPSFRRGLEILRDGTLGPVEQVHVFFSRGGRNYQQPPQGREPIPAGFDWNLWLAQLADRDYHSGWINRIGWRESSIGELGNFGPHSANLAFMALEVARLWDDEQAPPIRIEAECSEVNMLSYPRWERITWRVPARGDLPACRFVWHHGPRPDYAPDSRQQLSAILRDHGAPEDLLEELLPYAGCLIVGERGVLVANSHNNQIRLLPGDRFADVEQRRPQRLPFSPGHDVEWLAACRGEDIEPISRFEYAAAFAEFLNVGSLATRFPGQTLDFHPHAGTIPNHDEAQGFLSYAYRDGWTIGG